MQGRGVVTPKPLEGVGCSVWVPVSWWQQAEVGAGHVQQTAHASWQLSLWSTSFQGTGSAGDLDEKRQWLWSFLFCYQQRFLCKHNRSLCLCWRSTAGPSSSGPCGMFAAVVSGSLCLCVWVPSITPAWCAAVQLSWLLQGKSLVLNVYKSLAQWCSSDVMDIDYDLSPNFTSGKGQNILSLQTVNSPVQERITQTPDLNLQGLPHCSQYCSVKEFRVEKKMPVFKIPVFYGLYCDW